MRSLRNYLWIFVFGGIALGLLLPAPMMPLKNYLMYPLMVLVFLSALKIDMKAVRRAEHGFWRYLVVAVIVFFLPTLVAFFAGRNILPETAFIGLMIIAAAPTAIASVFVSDLLGGDSAKALIGTSFSNLISPLLTPLCIWIFIHKIISVPFADILILIGKLILIPFALAQIVRILRWEEKITKAAGWLNEFLLFLLIWGTIAPAQKNIFIQPKIFLFLFFIFCGVMVIQIAAGYFFGRNKKEKITWIVLGTSKNFTLASVLALTLFGAEALIAPAAFIVLSNSILIPLEWWARRKK